MAVRLDDRADLEAGAGLEPVDGRVGNQRLEGRTELSVAGALLREDALVTATRQAGQDVELATLTKFDSISAN